MPCSKVTLFLLFNTSWARASRMALVVKNLVANAGDAKSRVESLGREDPLEKEIVVQIGRAHV